MSRIVRLHRVGGPENLKLEEGGSSRQPGKSEVNSEFKSLA